MDRVVPAVLLGGVVGTIARWAIAELGWPAAASLLLINTTGCFVLGMVIATWGDRDHPLRLALGIGLCGGFTTFSGLAVDLALRLDQGEIIDAVGLASASVALGLVAFSGGRQVVG